MALIHLPVNVKAMLLNSAFIQFPCSLLMTLMSFCFFHFSVTSSGIFRPLAAANPDNSLIDFFFLTPELFAMKSKSNLKQGTEEIRPPCSILTSHVEQCTSNQEAKTNKSVCTHFRVAVKRLRSCNGVVVQYIWQYHSKSYDNHDAYSSVNGAAICTTHIESFGGLCWVLLPCGHAISCE